mmetsp:Transcript_3688/g.7052  ORF Transcript_3688/g.7052 Transcript_3688/m.7052 type:complete len:822 (-) Transcript_3688:971-3436(-)|eukprot:CAMPEP_0176492616 /NCGR_PEP_ID=MMETSP0200_2-20121128/9103_1 /TAXON_ID=947934 /ORGANISM="Chaetoceros sp., Strain GSL56" /LENGTH=821 /DNA_ID=CAMNT_0017890209 /DNA_START=92 /DNA_END=2557 /DNA_ORIENTATION=-
MKYTVSASILFTINAASAFAPNTMDLHTRLSHHQSRQHKSLMAATPPEGYKENLSGGVFFDGPIDFKIDTETTETSTSSSSSSLSKIQLGGNTNTSSQKKLVKQSYSQGKYKPNSPKTIPKDVVIIGAGLAGLSAALYISMNSNRQVTIVDKEDPFQQKEKTSAGSFAAAGMLAPQSERLPSGPLLDLCLESRNMYTEFVQEIENLASNCGEEARQYLWEDGNNTPAGCKLQPWEVGYTATGGFLAPAFAGDSVATWSPPVQKSAMWLDEIQVHEMEPMLNPEVIGGWWFPEDASVDARRLTCSLRAACVERGVQCMWGDTCAAASLELGDGVCKGVKLDDGRILTANSVVVANGSWMRNLLPVPITPHKGQSFSVRMPSMSEPLLSRVLFAQDTYIVPKADGRIVVGATVEAGSFDPNVTPAGLMHCMANAMQLVPGLGELPVEETWAGLRPTTPDKGPILGRTMWENLFIAGGYWRNGVLLAPKTGQLIGDLVIHNGDRLDNESDEKFLEAFHWDRFTEMGSGKKLAANTRYAAAMHPIHKRTTGMGVAAAVGTELGFYSGAREAAQERQKDRGALFQNTGISSDEDSAFEKAAKLGISDASTFDFGSKNDSTVSESEEVSMNAADEADVSSSTLPFDGSLDALTIGIASSSADEVSISSSNNEKEDGLESVYETIRQNKANATKTLEMNKAEETEEQPDPGFRVYYVDEETGEEIEIPPYTSPLHFFSNKASTNGSAGATDDEQAAKVNTSTTGVEIEVKTQTEDNETTYDGYQAIQQANSRGSRIEELEAMKSARLENRAKASDINESRIGVKKMHD